MNKIVNWFEDSPFLYFFAFSASILLSAWLGYHETVINPDGICYLLSAQIAGTATLHEITHLCAQSQWPFYPIIIYGFTQVSHLFFTAAAYVINGFFSILSVLSFILIVKELGGSTRVLWLAALTILLSHEFNSLRESIIRDHGFWAFYLISLLCLLHYFRKPQFIKALSFSASLFIAALFRIEAVIFLLTLPFIAWFYPEHSFKQRLKDFFSLNFLSLLLGAAIGIGLIWHAQSNMDKLGRLAEITNQFQHGITLLIERYQYARAALVQHVLTQDAASDAGLVLFLVWIAWYLVNVLTTLSWIYGALVIYAWYQKAASFTSRSRLIVGAYLAVNVLVTFCFLVERSFLSKRYLIALALILMLWVPFGLNHLIQKSHHLRSRIILYLAAFFIFISSLSGIIDFGYSKSYIRNAGDWIEKNIPAQASVYANDYQLMYYSKHFGNQIFSNLKQYLHMNIMEQEQWKKYDYLALRSSAKEKNDMFALLQELHISPVSVFSNKRGDKVAIYKINAEELIP